METAGKGAPGIEWVGPGMLLDAPQRPPQTMIPPQMLLVLRLRDPGLDQELIR